MNSTTENGGEVLTQNDRGMSDKKTLLDVNLPNPKHPTIEHISVITNN